MENKRTFSAADGTIAAAKRTPLIAYTTVHTTFTVAEPLMLSPFVFGSCHGRQGFYGTQSMSFTMNYLAQQELGEVTYIAQPVIIQKP